VKKSNRRTSPRLFRVIVYVPRTNVFKSQLSQLPNFRTRQQLHLPQHTMSRQGYLVLHEKRHGPKICFFSLEDGFLRYYATAHSVKMIGEVRLSGCKIAVKAHRRPDGMPNSFFLETRKVNVKDRSYTLSQAVRIELSAHSNEDRQEWGKVLFSWQRYYWRDPSDDDSDSVATQHIKTKAALEQIVARHYPSHGSSSCNNNQLEDCASSPSMASAALSVAKQPLSFLRKNASSLRRSFSMYMPSTTTSSSSTASSSSSVSSTGKGKPDCGGPEITDCEKDKVLLAKVAYAPEQPIYCGDNQHEPIAA
jgi:hypothetical protein